MNATKMRRQMDAADVRAGIDALREEVAGHGADVARRPEQVGTAIEIARAALHLSDVPAVVMAHVVAARRALERDGDPAACCRSLEAAAAAMDNPTRHPAA